MLKDQKHVLLSFIWKTAEAELVNTEITGMHHLRFKQEYSMEDFFFGNQATSFTVMLWQIKISIFGGIYNSWGQYL